MRLLLFALAVCLISCQRELDQLPDRLPDSQIPDTIVTEPPTTPPVVPPDKLVLTSVHGKILDDNGHPLPGVSVTVGNMSAFSNEYGIFRIQDVMVPEHNTFVRAEKAGFFAGSRTFVSMAGGNGYVQIKLLRKELKTTFSTGAGGQVQVNEFCNIDIQPNSIVDKSGLPYSGDVRIYAAVMNPEAQDFNDIMPGDLRGLRADSQYTALKSYGMVTVNLESASGAPLQLAASKSATLKMKVPATLASTAPATIPLWHFSESDGLWREEGAATLSNGWYTGTVSHFSTWNCDAPSAFVYVTLRVFSGKGGRKPYSRVKIIDTRNETYGEGRSDSAGNVLMWVPGNAPLLIQILNDCGDVLASEQRAAVNSDSDLGTIYANSSRASYVTGKVVDCNAQPITNGFANIVFGGLTHTTEIVDGQFYYYLDKCESGAYQADIYLSDINKQYETPLQTVTITGQTQDLGTFTNCNQVFLNEYVSYKLGTDSILAPGDRSYITYTGFANGDSVTTISFTHRMFDVGAYLITVQFKDSSVHTSVIENPPNQMLYTVDYVPVAPLTVNVEKYGGVGEVIHLTFSGMYKNTQTYEVVPLTGEMMVTRRE